ncbi:MAG: primosomal protein N' [Anaerolineae bacterium]|jgi:primosomal protein N' (replication factor Y)|nr:primosomal protein N' [Anaerolineae bacterium]
MYAEVALNTPVNQTFHYHIPAEMTLTVGHLVRVSFRTGMQPAIVIAITETAPIEKTKPIEARLDPDPVMTPAQLALARWISATYFAPIGLCVWLFLPTGLTGHNDLLLTLRQPGPRDHPVEQQVITALERRGSIRLRQLRTSVKDEHLEKVVKTLSAAGVIEAEPILSPPGVRPQVIQTAMIAIHPSMINEVRRFLGQKSRRADLLERIASHPPDLTVKQALVNSTKATLQRLFEEDPSLIAIEGDRVRLAIPPEQVDDQLLRLRKGETDLAVLRVLAREKAPIDVGWIYAQTGANVNILKRLAALELIHLGEKQTWRDSLAERDFVPVAPPKLSAGQQGVWEIIRTDPTGAFLLHGVTGSGKTEIYLRAIGATIAQGRQAIFLVPEIALTAQTIRRVAARFPGQVAVIHSRLSEGELYDTWRRAREGLIKVIVGTRSALFAPLPEVGCICVDEEHDDSYKNFASPHYDTRTIAEEMMRRAQGTLILGSATPDLTTFHRAQDPADRLRYLHLPERIMGHRLRITEQGEREGLIPRYHEDDSPEALMIELPPVTVIDMRAELKAGHLSIFSRALTTALQNTLKRGEQAILLMNRRGAATYVFCRDCGYVSRCDRCDTPLTYHQYSASLKCHHCGNEAPTPAICPNCKSTRIRFFGAGTQQVEAEIAKLFPKARVVRWDSDTASRPEVHDLILTRFLRHEFEVMVGTQLVAKGLDLPRVTLVGVISADIGLNLPDFRAGERAFQLLTQVAGRAGRGLLGGQVILQSYQPNHYVIKAAAQHDYTGFYTQELHYRRGLGYPPYRRLARILFQHPREAKARDEAQRAAQFLIQRIEERGLTGTEIIGPAPCFFTRLHDQYRWHLLIRSPDPVHLLNEIDPVRGWYAEIDPVDLL